MNWKIDHSQSNEGLQARLDFDLATDKPRKFVVSPNLLKYRAVSIELICASCTGTSGNVTVHESNIGTGAGPRYSTTETVTTGVDVSNYLKLSADVRSAYLHLEMPAGLGSTGRVTIILTAKE